MIQIRTISQKGLQNLKEIMKCGDWEDFEFIPWYVENHEVLLKVKKERKAKIIKK